MTHFTYTRYLLNNKRFLLSNKYLWIRLSIKIVMRLPEGSRPGFKLNAKKNFSGTQASRFGGNPNYSLGFLNFKMSIHNVLHYIPYIKKNKLSLCIYFVTYLYIKIQAHIYDLFWLVINRKQIKKSNIQTVHRTASQKSTGTPYQRVSPPLHPCWI